MNGWMDGWMDERGVLLQSREGEQATTEERGRKERARDQYHRVESRARATRRRRKLPVDRSRLPFHKRQAKRRRMPTRRERHDITSEKK